MRTVEITVVNRTVTFYLVDTLTDWVKFDYSVEVPYNQSIHDVVSTGVSNLHFMREDDDYDYDDSMDGDHDSAMASAGWGTDEDYGYYGEDY